ncbi:hypothetical protein ABZP36_003797 [Zizania latifolia]
MQQQKQRLPGSPTHEVHHALGFHPAPHLHPLRHGRLESRLACCRRAIDAVDGFAAAAAATGLGTTGAGCLAALMACTALSNTLLAYRRLIGRSNSKIGFLPPLNFLLEESFVIGDKYSN